MKHLLNSVMLFLCLFIWQNAWGQAVVDQGDLSSTITWKLTQTGTDRYALTVSGSGEMPDFETDKDVPWADYSRKITEIKVDEGVTKIGKWAFVHTAISSFEFPSTCTSICEYAFWDCTELKEIYIPESVTYIGGTFTFGCCRNLSLIHYDGYSTRSIAVITMGNRNTLAAKGKVIEKATTGNHNNVIPSGWEYYTHGEQCNGGAWVAESGTGDTDRKLFFYAQKPGATVNYASAETVETTEQAETQYHPWRVNCEKYTSLEINRNISVIGDSELNGYYSSSTGILKSFTNLQTITVENGNQNFVVGTDGVLYNKEKTKIRLYPATKTDTHFDIPETVTEIGAAAFCGAKNLQSISFLGTVNTIGDWAFAHASSLNYMDFKTEIAPQNYDKKCSFYGTPSNGTVVALYANANEFKNFTKAIGYNWTLNTGTTGDVRTELTSDGTLYVLGKGEYTTSSEDASWYDQRSSIKKIVVKEGITNIGKYAFENCGNVTEVTLNNSGTIGSCAFQNCSSLTRVNIGSGVSELKSDTIEVLSNLTLYNYPFKGCSKLTTINITDLKAFCAIKGLKCLTDSEYGTAKTKEPLMINGYAYPSTRTLVIPEGVTSISPYAFRYFSNVTKIEIPSSVKDIPAGNFSNHIYLTEVTLNNKGYIAELAFWNCSALSRVNIGSGVTELKSYTFEVSSNYTIYEYPFKGCSNLSTINVKDLKAYCAIKDLFYLTNSSYGTASNKTLMVNGSALSSTSVLEIPEGVTSISSDAFRGFTNLTKIKIPSTVTSVGWDAFSYCSNLERIICKATTCPSVNGSIATNPGSITLKVPTGTASLYKSASIWQKFNVEEGKVITNNMDMKANKTTKLAIPLKAISWSVSDESMASLTGDFASDGISRFVSSGDFVYDGTTEEPYKTVTITAKLEDFDTYIWNIKVYPSEITLTDGNAYKNATDFEAEKISYTRSFSKAGAWFALYLPFAIDIEAYKNDFDIAEIFTICPTTDTNGDGIVDASDSKKLILSRLNSGMTQPNAPYMIRTKAAKEYTIVSNNTTLASAEINEVEFATSRSQYTVKGIYDAGFYVKPGDNNYYMATSGSVSFATTKNVNIKPNRWFMHEEAKDYCGSSASNSASKFIIEVVGEDLDETTAIKLINGETVSSNGKSNSAYNINGMKVDASKNLPSGIYIINGKKVFKK